MASKRTSKQTKEKKKRIEFRVIAGDLKARRVVVPDLGVTRPPLTRLRKSIFDFLNPYLPDARYLDLFSGTGSYLFEAVSRGVAVAVGVEQEERLAGAINRQAQTFDVASRLQCRCEDVFAAIPRLYNAGGQFDIIMIAPPQYVGLIGRTLTALAKHPLLTDNGMAICQHDTSETDDIDWSGWDITQRRRYGNTTYTILQAPDA
ncbi:hypothetical protein GF377_04610 [candidate division GN15 bacterium]|nr:hypothetical protein [candidate division GN15 bacterium]